MKIWRKVKIEKYNSGKKTKPNKAKIKQTVRKQRGFWGERIDRRMNPTRGRRG